MPGPLGTHDPYLIHYPVWRRTLTAFSSPSPICRPSTNLLRKHPRRSGASSLDITLGRPGSISGARGSARRRPRIGRRPAAARRDCIVPRPTQRLGCIHTSGFLRRHRIAAGARRMAEAARDLAEEREQYAESSRAAATDPVLLGGLALCANVGFSCLSGRTGQG